MPREKKRKSPEVGYQPKKRQPKTNFQRKNTETKTSRNRILIVCEDSLSSPHYFDAMIRDYNLSGTDIRIYGEGGSAPSSVYSDAERIYREDAEKYGEDNTYDKVYCVFDKDQHADYDDTIEKCKQSTKIDAITSVPCFEVWLLFHFIDSEKPLENGETATKKLKEHIKKYDKANLINTYHDQLKNKTNTAIKNSESVMKRVTKAETDNPSSHIHILVKHLQKEAKKV